MAIAFQLVPGAVFSDAALKAVARAKPQIFKDDWLRVFEPAEIAATIEEMIR